MQMSQSLVSVVASSYDHEIMARVSKVRVLVPQKTHRVERIDLLGIMIVQFRNEKVTNHGSILITIDCNVVAFIVFEEGFDQPMKRTKQSVFLDVTVFRHTLVDWLHSECGSFVC
ncbi:hypothetical protein TNCV_1677071 [Trichonephila clavipes]|nr:hypothetical protein TNCV_1677071 [Trichonephila clavipes]